MENTKGYRKFVAFQRADNLVATVYQITKEFPKEEQLGLALHMRRLAYTIPMRIVEGYSHSSREEFYGGIKLAWSALTELEYFVDLSLRLGYITIQMYHKLADELVATSRSLKGLLEGLRQKTGNTTYGVIAEAHAVYILAG